MKVIAHIRTAFAEKFGVPRQSALAPNTRGYVVFEPEFRRLEALRGLDGFDWIWLIWEFSENGSSCQEDKSWQATVRPPRLGGNKRMGVFATRSTFRPNPIGLSSVRLVHIIEQSPDGPMLEVAGADLVDGTPIFDIKPYIPYCDCHPEAASGWLEQVQEKKYRVIWPEECEGGEMDSQLRKEIEDILSLDPRPSYISDTERIYGVRYGDYNIRFCVDDEKEEVRVVEWTLTK